MLLERLSKLASERSSESRVALLREITDLFLKEPDIRGTARMDLFDDVMCRVVGEATQAARTEMAERLSRSETAPRGVIRRLASDAIEVAQSLLRWSPVLDDADLASIARTRTERHRKTIARRDTLSEQVTDVLVEHGGTGTVQAVANNTGARFSRSGYG